MSLKTQLTFVSSCSLHLSQTVFPTASCSSLTLFHHPQEKRLLILAFISITSVLDTRGSLTQYKEHIRQSLRKPRPKVFNPPVALAKLLNLSELHLPQDTKKGWQLSLLLIFRRFWCVLFWEMKKLGYPMIWENPWVRKAVYNVAWSSIFQIYLNTESFSWHHVISLQNSGSRNTNFGCNLVQYFHFIHK